MPASKLRQQQMRQRIAAAAARIMAEDGIDDYALAKRKAARQLGAEDTQSLPANDEIEQHLRSYLTLYQEDEQRERLRTLRSAALEVMENMQAFHPYLFGAVLNGTAGRYSEIDLQLFTDDAKAVEIYLLNRGIPYEVTEQRRLGPDSSRSVPVLKCEWDGLRVNLRVFSANDERASMKSAGGKAIERAAMPAVRQLLQDSRGS